MPTSVPQPEAETPSGREERRPVWLLWDCADLVAVFDTEADAYEARADLQHRLLCDYGPDLELLETVTVTTAHAPDPRPAPARVAR